MCDCMTHCPHSHKLFLIKAEMHSMKDWNSPEDKAIFGSNSIKINFLGLQNETTLILIL